MAVGEPPRARRRRSGGRGVAVDSAAEHLAPDPAARGADPDPVDAVQERLAVQFRDRTLLRQALIHPSWANEHPEDASGTNERLEFLGDAVLGLIVAEQLYHAFPDVEEGRLTEWRAQLVCGPTLARVAAGLELGDALLLGRGEEGTGGREREGNLERVFEAVVGAILLDGGLEGARAFAQWALADEFAALNGDPADLNPKGILQQLTQNRTGRPLYELVEQHGPDHDRVFDVRVRIDDEVIGYGSGRTKQEAEKIAAREALELLRSRGLAVDDS